MAVREVESLTVVSASACLNAILPRLVTVLGREIAESAVHPSNARLLIVLSPSESCTVFSFVQPWKTPSERTVTLEGMLIVFSAIQPAKAYAPIEETLSSGRLISESAVQPLKAF